MAIIRSIVRFGIYGGVIAGAAVLFAGPQRVSALFGMAKGAVIDTIDDSLGEPAALRSQLRTLEAQYPERISELRGDLAELVEQKRQAAREKAVSERVVALADRDLEQLSPLVSEAEAARATALPGQVVAINYAGDVLPFNAAQARTAEIRRTRMAYAGRASDAARDLSYLEQQEQRLRALLDQLETERAEFRSQIWQLDRQVDSIARNDRLIELMNKRQATMDEVSRFEGVSLDRLRTNMAEVRSRQEAELDLLAHDQRRLDYEDVARGELDAALPAPGGDATGLGALLPPPGAPGGEVQVITIGPRSR